MFEINNLPSSDWAGYRALAKEFIVRFSQEAVVIVRNHIKDFSLNDFALALFVSSCQLDNNIECAVFKVADSRAATSAYKPYVALTVAVKYIMRLGKESLDEVYKDISTLGYLGIDVKHDYINHKLFLSLPGKGDVPIIKADNITEEKDKYEKRDQTENNIETWKNRFDSPEISPAAETSRRQRIHIQRQERERSWKNTLPAGSSVPAVKLLTSCRRIPLVSAGSFATGRTISNRCFVPGRGRGRSKK